MEVFIKKKHEIFFHTAQQSASYYVFESLLHNNMLSNVIRLYTIKKRFNGCFESSYRCSGEIGGMCVYKTQNLSILIYIMQISYTHHHREIFVVGGTERNI